MALILNSSSHSLHTPASLLSLSLSLSPPLSLSLCGVECV